MGLKEEILDRLKSALGSDLGEVSESKAYENTVVVEVSPDRVVDVAEIMKREFDARIAHEFGVEDELGYKVYYVYDLSPREKYLHVIVTTRIPRDGSVESIAPVAEEVLWAEREYAELLGVRYSGHPDGETPRHQFLPHEWPEMPEKGTWVTTPRPIGAYSIMPIGPYHPVLLEAAYIRVMVEGEDVLDVDIKTGFNHRGIMKLAEKRDLFKGLHLCTRICGICNAAHSQAYVNAAEHLLGIEAPERAKYIRVLCDELNRIHSHLLYLGVAGYLAGFETLLMLAFRYREEVMDAMEMIAGNRVLMEMHTIGGVRRDVPDALIPKVEKKLEAVEEATKNLMDVVLGHRVLRARLEDVGILELADAKKSGAVGPTARGSAWNVDIRRDDPCEVYGDLSWEVIVEDGKDSLARTLVRLREALVSVDICKQCLDALKKVKGPIKLEKLPRPESGAEGMGLYEAPRGELLHHVIADGSDKPYRLKVKTPTFSNLLGIARCFPGHTIADVPAILVSMDPCFCCQDRLLFVDAKTGKRWSATPLEIALKYWR